MFMPRLNKQGSKIILQRTYNEERKIILEKIKEAELLGELDEVNRLQRKWQSKKVKYHK